MMLKRLLIVVFALVASTAPLFAAAQPLADRYGEEFSDVGPARVILGSDVDTQLRQAGAAGGRIVAVQGQPFEAARRWEIANRPKHLWQENLTIPLEADLRKGEHLLILLHARGEAIQGAVFDGDETAHVQLLVQDTRKSGKGGHITSYHGKIKPTAQWERHWLRDADAVPHDVPKEHGRLFVMLGKKAQNVELGGIVVLAFPPDANLDAMPQKTWGYVGRAADAAWRAEAEQRIDRYRKADLTVTVVDAAGNPVPDATVHVEMQRHAFPFGTMVTLPVWNGEEASAADQRKYREILETSFNAGGPGNALKWKLFKQIDKFDPQKTEELMRWLKERNFRTRGHVLVWPGTSHLPRAQRDLINDPAALRSAVLEHVRWTMSRWSGLVDDWDITNETRANRQFMDVLGPEAMVAWYQAAREADPDAMLTFLEPAFSHGIDYGSFEAHGIKPGVGWVGYLLEHDAPVDSLGSQSHGGMIKSADGPRGMWAEWDDLHERFGLPLQFTEVDIDIDDDTDPAQLAYQADLLRDSIITAFAHPHVIGVQQWGFWKKAHWKPRAALWREDWSIKPNGQAYIDLVYKRWWTDETKRTTADGKTAVRAFHGTHRVTAEHDGQRGDAEVRLGPDGTSVTIRLQ